MFDVLILDLRYALRTLRRNLGFTLGAIAVLALGIGANTFIFTLARALVFQKLPFPEPDRLVAVWKERIRTGARQGASWPNLADWEAQKHVFEGVAAYMDSSEYAWPYSPEGTAEPVSDIHVTEGFFRILGVQPAMGRLFEPGEFGEQKEIASVEPVIISHDFWRRRMGASRDAVDRFMTIGGVRHFVIGVLPPEFRMFRASTPEVFSPLRAFPGHSMERRMAYLTVLARLKEGVTISQARVEMSAYSSRAASEYPATESGLRCNLESLHDHWFGALRPLMFLLLGTVAVVLSIACANVAFLFLVRATRREGEIALRLALGAGKVRISRELMIEALLLAAAGGLAGFLGATWMESLFAAFSSAADMRLPSMKFDGAVAAFTILISLATAAMFGLAPAWRVANLDLQRHLKTGSAAGAGGIARHSGRAAIIAEVALSTLLLTGAATLLKAFLSATSAHPGFDVQHTVTLSIGKIPFGEGFSQRQSYFWLQLLERANSLPGVRAAAICRAFPLSEEVPPARMITRITPDDNQSRDFQGVEAEFQDVTPDYFRALGIAVLRGRTFDSRDISKDHPNAYQQVAVINQGFARALWGDADPIGKRIVSEGRRYTVVGVAADVKQHGLWRTSPEFVVYRPLWLSDIFKSPTHTLVVRTSEDPGRMSGVLKGLVRSLDAERPIVSARTMKEVIFQSTAWERLRIGVVSLFGAAALILTIAGVYAPVSYSVMLRQREIAIRIALGGGSKRIQAMAVRHGVVAAATGAAGGTLAAWALSRAPGAKLYGLNVVDLPTLLGISILMIGVTLVACYFPARWATRLDPSISLRAE